MSEPAINDIATGSQTGGTSLAALNDEAWVRRRKEPKQALELAYEAKRVAEHVGNQYELARSLCTLGHLLAFSNDDSEAKGYLDEALRLSESNGDIQTATWTLYGLTKAAFRFGDIKGALAYAMRTREQAAKADLPELEGHALNAMGAVYKEMGIFQEALKSFRQSLDLQRSIGETDDSVVPLYNINLIYTELGEYDQALTYARAALEAFEKSGDVVNATGALINIGELHAHLEHYDQAMTFLNRGLQGFVDLDNRHFVAGAHYHLGNTFRKIGDFDQARSHYRAALDGYRDGHHDADRVRVLIGLGELHFSEGDQQEALRLLDESVVTAGAAGLKKHLVQVHLALSRIHKELGQHREALEHFETHHTLSEEMAGEKLKSVMEGMQMQFDIEKDHHRFEVDRLTSGELAQLNQKLRALSEQLEQQSIRDELTQLYNRRYLNTKLAESFTTARRDGHPLSVVICDIDHFKGINDTYSHAVGDRVLRAVAILLEKDRRGNDLVARYGGEEFVLILPEASLDGAKGACERTRALIENHDWSHIHPDLRVTMSFGVSDCPDFDHHEKLLNAADEMLYQAKNSGRNRVCG